MPPLHPKLKNDGPACRVCGCTEHNACPNNSDPNSLYCCSWVKTRGADVGPLCSACSGTGDDAYEAFHRIDDLLAPRRPSSGDCAKARYIATAFQKRCRARKKKVDAAP